MVLKIQTERFTFEAGIVNVLAKVQTDRGICGLSMAFDLRKNPELDSLVGMIDDAIRTAIAKNFGIVQPVNGEAKA